MKINYLPTIAASVIVLVLLNSVEAAKEKRGGHRRKLKPIDESDETSPSKEPEFSECPYLTEQQIFFFFREIRSSFKLFGSAPVREESNMSSSSSQRVSQDRTPTLRPELHETLQLGALPRRHGSLQRTMRPSKSVLRLSRKSTSVRLSFCFPEIFPGALKI